MEKPTPWLAQMNLVLNHNPGALPHAGAGERLGRSSDDALCGRSSGGGEKGIE